MKLDFARLCIVVAVSLAHVATQAMAKDDDDPVLMAQLAQLKKQCEQQHAQSKRREQELEAAKADASLPPARMQEVEQKIETLKAAIARTDAFLATPLPPTKEGRESYLGQASAAIAAT